MPKLFSFPKEQHLCLQCRIDAVYNEGKSLVAYPLRVAYKLEDSREDLPSACMLVSVAKRRFRRANKRNRIKRLVREAYRLNKSILIPSLNLHQKRIDLAFMMISDEMPTYDIIEKAVLKAFGKICKENNL